MPATMDAKTANRSEVMREMVSKWTRQALILTFTTSEVESDSDAEPRELQIKAPPIEVR